MALSRQYEHQPKAMIRTEETHIQQFQVGDIKGGVGSREEFELRDTGITLTAPKYEYGVANSIIEQTKGYVPNVKLTKFAAVQGCTKLTIVCGTGMVVICGILSFLTFLFGVVPPGNPQTGQLAILIISLLIMIICSCCSCVFGQHIHVICKTVPHVLQVGHEFPMKGTLNMHLKGTLTQQQMAYLGDQSTQVAAAVQFSASGKLHVISPKAARAVKGSRSSSAVFFCGAVTVTVWASLLFLVSAVRAIVLAAQPEDVN